MDVEWGSEIMRGMVTDISLGGMFIATSSPLWVGATFTARVFLGEPLRLDAIVRRVVPQRGMGVEFVDVDGTAQGRFDGWREMIHMVRGYLTNRQC